ncbi:MAG: radical SAM family heme chaperone HemW [Candidatus Zixiibacteriota bacterium]
MPLGLYVHYPFCQHLCSYCTSCQVLHSRDLEKQFFQALITETELTAEKLVSDDTIISSIYVGGGTPSLASLDLFADWLEHLKHHFKILENVEFTLEFNPESATRGNLTAFKELGVNRPIFGVQTFDSCLLKILHRKHTAHHSHRAIYCAYAIGYRNFGVDLIFGVPTQTSRRLSADLDQLLDLEPPHITIRQLTLKPGTRLAEKVTGGNLRMPGHELIQAMYRGNCERLSEAGYVRYEVSSFAKPGFECHHKLDYWEGNDLLGLGLSAHSFIDGEHFLNVTDLGTYIEQLKTSRLPRVPDRVGVEKLMIEAIAEGLRTTRGINRSRFSDRFGVPIEARLNRSLYYQLVESGHLLPELGNLRLSDTGILQVDEITKKLIE